MRRALRLGRHVLQAAQADHVGRVAAALAFFAIFSLPGLLVLVVGAASVAYDAETVRGRVLDELSTLVGPKGAAAVGDILSRASSPQGASLAGQIIGAASLVFGATGFFLQLQDALNTMWGAESLARRRGVGAMVRKRLLSLGMVLAIALLLVVSTTAHAVLAAFGDRIAASLLGDTAKSGLLVVAEAVVSTALIAALLGAIYCALPDLKIEWREVALGACVTAVLVSAGKFAIGFYLGRSDPGSVYGAAGPLVLLLLWVYYSAWIVVLGAEFTQAYSCLHGPNRVERARRRREREEKRRVHAT